MIPKWLDTHVIITVIIAPSCFIKVTADYQQSIIGYSTYLLKYLVLAHLFYTTQ